ncbi:MAG: FkbM family methyltransferase [Gelidibacter sp.]
MSLKKSLRKKIRKHNFNKSLENLPKKKLKNGGKRLFIDCGSNVGQGYEYFRTYFTPESYDVVMIEPNPNCMQIIKEKFSAQKNVEFIEAAAWIDYNPLYFYGLVEDERGKTTDGGSVITDHNSIMYEVDKRSGIQVSAISLSDLIIEKAKTYHQIVIKMDIESAEYEVLADILKTDAKKYISYMYIEFHSQYFKESEREQYLHKEKHLIKNLRRNKVGVSLWH